MNKSPLNIKSFEIKRPDFNSEFHLGILNIETVSTDDFNCKEVLSDIELEYFNSISHSNRQKSYFAGRFIAKSIISKLTNINDLSTIVIDKGAFGHPVIIAPNKQNLQVSISHSTNWAVALAYDEKHPMAIDVEDPKDQKLKVLQRSFDTEELMLIQHLAQECESSELKSLCMGWTLKESLSKVIKTGMTSSLDLYKVKSIEKHASIYTSRFKNLTQYQAISFNLGNSFCSWVMPYKSEFDTLAFENFIKSQGL